MDITGEYRVPLPREAVFAALNDPDVLGRCIPGCESLERVGEDEYSADVVAKIGPVKARIWDRGVDVTDLEALWWRESECAITSAENGAGAGAGEEADAA